MHHNTKKFATLLLSCLLILSMFLCSVGFAEEESKGLIVIMTPAHSNPFFKVISDSATQRAEELGYEVLSLQHDDDVVKQNEIFETAIARGAVGIVCDNAGAEATVEPARTALEAGIPTVMVGREINQTGVALAQLVSNNYQGAQLLAEYFIETVGEEGGYVEILGKESDTNAHIRTSGFHDIIDQYPNITMVAQQTGNWNQTEAYEKMESIIQSNAGEFVAVYAPGDPMALGCYEALKKAGITDVLVFGFDGNNDARDSILRGEVAATILQPISEMSMLAVDIIDDYVQNGTKPEVEKQLFDCILITAENADKLDNFVYTE